MSVILRAAGNVYGIGSVLGVDADVTFAPYGVPASGGGGGGSDTVLFAPTFSGTGATHATLLNGEWDSTTGADPSITAATISSSGLGAPAGVSRLLELTMRNPGSPPACLVIKDNVYTRAAGYTVALRFATRVDQTDSILDHPVKFGSGVGAENTITVVPLGYVPSATGWSPFIRTYWDSAGADIGYPLYVWSYGTELAYATWYDVECLLEFVTASTYRIHLRIFNPSDDSLITSSADWVRQDGSGSNNTLTAFYAGTGTWSPTPRVFGCNATNPDAIEQFAMGNHGPTGAVENLEKWYYGPPRIVHNPSHSSADARWIGP